MLADSLDPSLTKEAARGDMLKKMVNALVNRGANATPQNAPGAIERLYHGANWVPSVGASSIRDTLTNLIKKYPAGQPHNPGQTQQALAQLTGKSPWGKAHYAKSMKGPFESAPTVSQGAHWMEMLDAGNGGNYTRSQDKLKKMLGQGERF